MISTHMCDDKLQCIHEEGWCDARTDGYFGCVDGSDELPSNCVEYECIATYWKCADNLQCLKAKHVCDGRGYISGIQSQYGCKDKSDEHNKLCGYCTRDGEWPCQDGDGCADTEQVCDGSSHCNDGSDEYRDVCLTWNCTEEMWKCHDNRLCIPRSSVCDGEINCIDSSDETDCLTYTCLENARKCANNEECIEIKAICDGEIDCLDGSDEMCSASCLETPLEVRTIVRRCTEDSTKCFPVERYCDRMADCPHGSDEGDSFCSCDDWNMYMCKVGASKLCIYQEWIDMESSHLCNIGVMNLNDSEGNTEPLNLLGKFTLHALFSILICLLHILNCQLFINVSCTKGRGKIVSLFFILAVFINHETNGLNRGIHTILKI